MREPAADAGLGADSARRFGLAAAAVTLVTLLPFARGLWRGHSFYFRDLTISFLPLRRYIAEGLRRLEVRDWVPWVHEGSPVHLPPLGYPVELLQALAPSEAWISFLLALHVPLAGLSMLYLSRCLGAGALAGFAAAALYALGGFALSTLNLYFYAHALAWAPMIAAALLAAAASGRHVAPAALVVAVGVSTFGPELVLQALAAGALLALWPLEPARVGRLAVAGVLGVALAAVPLSLGADLTPGSARGAGFTADVVLGHSVHPLSLLQVVIGSFHGDLADPTRYWWGQNFFPRGFPYILSLYLGALALALAWVGLRHGRGPRYRLGLLAGAALLLCLGRWAGLTPLVESFPWRPLRYPVKAFFSVHLAVALLAGLGLESLRRQRPEAWRALAAAGLGLGGALLGLALVPRVAPGAWAWFLGGFLPPGVPPGLARLAGATLLGDAATGGGVALGAGVVALLSLRGRLRVLPACLAVAGLLAADLLRTGAGLNPMVSPEFFRLSPEMRAQLDDLRQGRVFSCDYSASGAYQRRRAELQERGRPHEQLSFAAARETLSHHLSVLDEVPTARGIDLTMWVPEWRVLSPEQASCSDLVPLVPLLRAAAVHRVLSLDPLRHPELRPLRVVRPARLEPLAVFVYALEHPLPLVEVATRVEAGAPFLPGREPVPPAAPGVVSLADAGPEARDVTGEAGMRRPGSDRIELEVRADAGSAVVVREAWAPGWTARLDGRPAPVILADGRHLAIRVPRGSSRVQLDYAPPARGAALALSAAAAVVLALLAWRSRVWAPSLDTPRPRR